MATAACGERSPFMVEFLKQIDALTAAFRNLPVEDYKQALTHIQNLLEDFSGASKTDENGEQAMDDDCCQVCFSPVTLDDHGDVRCGCDGRPNSPEDDSGSDQNYVITRSQNVDVVRRNRRKVARPRRCSELYDTALEIAADKSNNTRSMDKLPKADVVGCQVVRDFKGDERFQCHQCELKFSYYAALLRHLDARHKTFDANQKIQEVNKKAVSCDQCGATLSSKGALHAHMQMHAGVQPFHCDICKKKFSLKSNLLRHKRIHAGLKPYQCDICNKSFTEKRSVEVHRRIHTGERPYSCDICGTKFSQLGSWMGHRDTHKGKNEPRYECEICGKLFTQKVGLHNHRKRHHDKRRNHQCVQCTASFFSLEELRLHKVTHSGEKQFLCAECGKSFSRQQTLKSHMKQHQKVRDTLQCSSCPDTFTSSRALSLHTKIHGGVGHVSEQSYIDASVAAAKDVAQASGATLALTADVHLAATEGELVNGVLTTEHLSVLPKDVLAAYSNDGGISASSSEQLLEVISKGQIF